MRAAPHIDIGAAGVAATIGEPARARMLYRLLDGHARTSTELAAVGEVSASTASVHLAKMTRQRLVTVLSQGKHRYYSLAGPSVARALEALTVVAGGAPGAFTPSTPAAFAPRAHLLRPHGGPWGGDVARSLRGARDGSRLTGAAATAMSSRRPDQALAEIGIDIDAIRALRGDSLTPASTGANAGRTSAGRSGTPCSTGAEPQMVRAGAR